MNEFEMKVFKIATKAIKEAQKESLKMGVANVYSKNKQIYFQLPDGRITQETPKEYRSLESVGIVDKNEASRMAD